MHDPKPKPTHTSNYHQLLGRKTLNKVHQNIIYQTILFSYIIN